MLTLLALTAALVVPAAEAPPPESLRWEARPILVVAKRDDPRLARQIALFEAERDALEERDSLVVVAEPGSALAARHGADGFTVLLIGKDGGVKYRSGTVTEPETLHALIDRMPMRRREMRESAD